MAARELRDRWMERANAGMLIGSAGGKYDVSRGIAAVNDEKLLMAG